MDKEPTKLETIRRLICRKRGASMDELMRVTGWQKGSVEGNIGKLRRKGLHVTRDDSPRRGTVFHGENGMAH